MFDKWSNNTSLQLNMLRTHTTIFMDIMHANQC